MDESPPMQPIWKFIEELGLDMPVCRRVLVVDDEPDNLAILVMLLEDDWEVLTATNGREALGVLDRVGAVDLVIADQRMPKMTGVELLSEVAERYPETVSFVLTGYVDVEPIVAAVNRGKVYRFLMKPWDAVELRSAVADALELRTNRRAHQMVVACLAERRISLTNALRELQDAQEHAMATERITTLGRLTSGTMHDIRNHITVLMWLVRTLQEEIGDPAVADSGRLAVRAIEKLYQLVREVNAFSRNISDTLRVTEVPISSAVEEVIALLRMESGASMCPTEFSIEAGAEYFRADEERVRQGLLVLLRDVLGRAPAGATVRVTARRGPEGAGLLTVCLRESAPQGSGSPGEPTAVPVPVGMGLGLEIARLVAEAHGGTVEALSMDDRLIGFRMRLAGACGGAARDGHYAQI